MFKVKGCLKGLVNFRYLWIAIIVKCLFCVCYLCVYITESLSSVCVCMCVLSQGCWRRMTPHYSSAQPPCSDGIHRDADNRLLICAVWTLQEQHCAHLHSDKLWFVNKVNIMLHHTKSFKHFLFLILCLDCSERRTVRSQYTHIL